MGVVRFDKDAFIRVLKAANIAEPVARAHAEALYSGDSACSRNRR
jgi:hypothetical protein